MSFKLTEEQLMIQKMEIINKPSNPARLFK